MLRVPILIFLIMKYKINVVSSDGFFIALSAKLLNIPAIMHSDDFEYKFSYKMTQLFSSKMIIPDVFPRTSKKDIPYRGCKECAYLSNTYYTPDRNVLNGILDFKDKYIFIRLVAKTSLNYLGGVSVLDTIALIIDFLAEKNIKVLISSEDYYENQQNNCTLLTPPIKNFHSILRYAILTITEGDTMARESAVLGTPVIYMGGRSMKVHEYFNKSNLFLETKDINKIVEFIEGILGKDCKRLYKKKFDDINKVMVYHIEKT